MEDKFWMTYSNLDRQAVEMDRAWMEREQELRYPSRIVMLKVLWELGFEIDFS